MKQNYLVTGGAGFIGSALTKKFIESGCSVTVVDNLSTGFADSIPEEALFVKANVYDDFFHLLPKLKYDAIFHIAGQSSGEISFEDPIYDIRTNAESTLRLMQFAIKNNCPKFIYASTMSVYGEQNILPANETAIPNPISFYAIGKLASEQYMRVFSNKYNLKTCALRLFNVYGPGQNLLNLKQGMISIFLSYLLKNEPILVKGDLNRFRDFVYIDDVTSAFFLSLQNEQPFDIYNVCSGKKVTIDEMLKLLIHEFGNAGKTPSVISKGNTPGDQFGIFGDYTKINKQFLWTPQTSLKDGLSKMIYWAKNKIN